RGPSRRRTRRDSAQGPPPSRAAAHAARYGRCEEERLAGARGHVSPQPRHRAVGPVVGAVITLAIHGMIEEGVVLDELRGREVMRLATEEPIKAIEAPRQRPRGPVRGG